jgi:hypothetical protein
VDDDLFPIPVYGAMLAATLVGQFAGIAFDAFALHGHSPLVPLAFSVLLEGIVGARYGATLLGHPLTARDRGRISITYTLALIVVSLPLAAWLSVSGHFPLPHISASTSGVALGVLFAVGLAVLCTGVRFVVMGVFTRRG